MNQEPSVSKAVQSFGSPSFGEIAVGLKLDPTSLKRIRVDQVGSEILGMIQRQHSKHSLVIRGSGGLKFSKNTDNRFEFGPREIVVLSVENRRLEILSFDPAGQKLEAFSNNLADLGDLTGQADKTSCELRTNDDTRLLEIKLQPGRDRPAKYYLLSSPHSQNREVQLILAVVMRKIGVHEVDFMAPASPPGVAASDFWHRIRIGRYGVALGFATSSVIRADVPYSMSGDFLCMEIASKDRSPADLRMAKDILVSRGVKDAVASLKIIDLPYPCLCVQFHRDQILKLENFLSGLKSIT